MLSTWLKDRDYSTYDDTCDVCFSWGKIDYLGTITLGQNFFLSRVISRICLKNIKLFLKHKMFSIKKFVKSHMDKNPSATSDKILPQYARVGRADWCCVSRGNFFQICAIPLSTGPSSIYSFLISCLPKISVLDFILDLI